MSYPDLFLLILLLCLLLLTVLGIREVLRVRRHYWEGGFSRLFECKNCHYSFVDKNEVNVTRCPRCNAICFRRVK